MTNRKSGKDGRVEALLDRLDTLPTPSPVAMRLLSVLDDATSTTTTPEVVELVSSDPALAGRVIATCARHPRYRSYRVDSIERAVVLLGFEAVRVTALSVRFFEAMSGFSQNTQDDVFDIGLFWRHSLSVAVLSERIAERSGRVSPSTAFVSGLLHDIGHLGLCAIAPRIFRSACEMAEMECTSVDAVVGRHLGIDGRSAGRRIGSHWRLPGEITDAMWLVDQPVEVMRKCASPELAMIVSLADAMVSRDHICVSGHGVRASAINELAEELRVDVQSIRNLRSSVLEEVDARAEAMGLQSMPTTEVLLQSVSRANAVLGRFALAYRDQVARVDRCESDIDSLVRFHESGPFLSVNDVIDGVGDSARSGAEGTTACVILPAVEESGQPVIRLRSHGVTRHVEFSAGMPSDVARDVLSRHCLDRVGHPVRLQLRDGGIAVVALGCAIGADHDAFEPSQPLQAAWTTAIDDALARERVSRLAESLAEANREIMMHRETMAQARAAAAIGAIAAGAAHEINNPLAIITGRSHLLGRCLAETELSGAAGEIQNAAAKVSALVEALSESVAPIEINRVATDVATLMAEASSAVDSRLSGGVAIRCSGNLPMVELDSTHMRSVIRELLDNALRMGSGECVTIDARVVKDVLRIQVTDCGPGFSEKAIEHAFQPFFSDHAAGRRPGLGLANARRMVEAHGGSISLKNRQGCGGAEVTVYLPLGVCTAFTDGNSLQQTRGVA